jgi:hypothetical protein
MVTNVCVIIVGSSEFYPAKRKTADYSKLQSDESNLIL